MTDRILRPGGSWSAKAAADPDVHLLVTLVSCNPDEIPDWLGRRPSDQCVGQVLADFAAEVCTAVNASRAARNANDSTAARLLRDTL